MFKSLFQKKHNKLDAQTVEKSLEKTLAIHNDGLEKFYKLREKWSFHIATLLYFLILSQIILTTLIGAGYLDFREYEWFIGTVVVESFLQIVGMGLIIIKFLFTPNNEVENE